MRIRVLGGFSVEHDSAPIEITGAVQRALLFRLAIDAGSVVTYRAISEDLWPDDPPLNPRASLHSLISRLRPQLPAGVLESASGGYRLAIARDDVDAVRFQDLVLRASADSLDGARLAQEALTLWLGAPWTPGDGYDWFERALEQDRSSALALLARTTTQPTNGGEGPSHVPAPLTGLVGRDIELETISTQFAGNRLVTLLGPGGAGKTRLAIEYARLSPGAVLVELAPAGPDELWQAILGGVGRAVRAAEIGSGGPSPLERIASLIGGREIVLVLDNCEHLIAAAAEAAQRLLEELPRLRILATSREPLGVSGEAFVPLGPLDDDAAATLFDERVRSARGTPLAVNERDIAARIRTRLDGLPLALELAAAKARTLTVREIADGLDDRFALLSGGLRTVLPRHQTLRALVDWSWDLLSGGERAALMALAAYPAGVAASDAARFALAHDLPRDGLDALVDKSLAHRTDGRYRALETIREYGLEQLAFAGSLETVRRAQGEWISAEAETRDVQLHGAEISAAIGWFDAEDDNIAAAMRWSIDSGDAIAAIRLGAANAWYWLLRDRGADALGWFRALGDAARELDSDAGVLVDAAATIGAAVGEVGDPGQLGALPHRDRMTQDAERVLARMAGRENQLLQAVAVGLRAYVDSAGEPGWPISVRFPPHEQIAGTISPWSLALLDGMRAAIAQNRGDIAELGASSERSLAAFSELGDVWGLGIAKQIRSEWLTLQGRLEEALELSESATAALRQVSSDMDLQQQQTQAVGLLMRLDRNDEARTRAEELLRGARATGAAGPALTASIGAARVYLMLGEVDLAREVVTAADALALEWRGSPKQLRALLGLIHAAIALADGDVGGARERLRAAADDAVGSMDHPVMAQVAIAIGVAALAGDDASTAERALALARTLRGAPDPTEPGEKRLVAGLAAAGIEAPERSGLDRRTAAEQLGQILRR